MEKSGADGIGDSKAGGVKAASTQADIPITFVNNTGTDDPTLSVVVFTKSGSDRSVTAWKVGK